MGIDEHGSLPGHFTDCVSDLAGFLNPHVFAEPSVKWDNSSPHVTVYSDIWETEDGDYVRSGSLV